MYCGLKFHGTQYMYRAVSEHFRFHCLSLIKKKAKLLHNKTATCFTYFEVLLSKFLVDMSQAKIKFRLKFFNLGWLSRYYLCL